MIKAKKSILIAFVFLILVISFNNCSPVDHSSVNGNSGTVVGNPMAPVSNKILTAVCEVVTTCHAGISWIECAAGVNLAPGMSAPLGLSSQYSTLASIANAERTGEVIASTEAANQCASNIQALTCSNPIVQSAYVPNTASPFAGSVHMVSGQSCAQALAPVIRYACTEKVFLRGAANPVLSPTQSTAGVSYSVTPALPAGLSLDPTSGAISGNPSIVSPSTAYTITASAAGLSKSTTIQIKTVDGFLVNDLGDTNNVGPGCVDSSGKCTLRAALQKINADTTPNVLVLPAGVIQLSSGIELAATKPVEIYGDCSEGTKIDGLGTTRVLHASAGPLMLNRITVQNGSINNDTGAGIFLEATTAPYNVVMTDVTVQNNSATGASGGSAGIEIGGSTSNALNVSIDRCTLKNNSAQGVGGAIGVQNPHVLTMTNCSIEGNTATHGAGVLVNGTANISKSLFQLNTASLTGGALYCASNVSGARKANLSNITVTNNQAGRGGGLVVANSCQIEVEHATIVNNRSTDATYGGGISQNGSGSVKIKNSIIASNESNGSDLNCGPGTFITSLGYNLSDSNTCSLSATGDRPNATPALGPLQDNGGSTSTFAVLAGSGALDAVPGHLCSTIDQRGVPRNTAGTCDIGAFEMQ